MLDLAAVIRIGPEFSPAEQDRARAAAARDPRLPVALGAAGYGLTQTLAAAPQLVARWEDAQTADPYAWAVLTAALDVARLGARAPLSADLLRAAAPGYCTSAQQAEAPDNWFEQALAYATDKLHGAAAALSPAGAGMGQVAGYTVGGLPDPARQPGTPLRPRARQHLGRPPQPHPRPRRRRPARRQRPRPAAVPLRHPAVPPRRRRRRRGRRPAAGRAAGRARATWTSCAPGPTPATGTPPCGWPGCWPSAATWTSCAPGPTPATGMPPSSWPGCWPSAATWTRLRARADAGDEDAAMRLAELLAERGDLDEALRSARPGRRRRPGCRHTAGRAAGRARRPGRAARPGRRRRPGCHVLAGHAAGPAR